MQASGSQAALGGCADTLVSVEGPSRWGGRERWEEVRIGKDCGWGGSAHPAALQIFPALPLHNSVASRAVGGSKGWREGESHGQAVPGR